VPPFFNAFVDATHVPPGEIVARQVESVAN